MFLILQKDPKKWRIRHLISSQLESLSRLYDPEITFKYIFPIALKLCNDNVSDVRETAALNILAVVYRMAHEEDYKIMAIESIKGFGVSEKFVQRQTFARIVSTLSEYKQFE